jgi:hypothetical protein
MKWVLLWMIVSSSTLTLGAAEPAKKGTSKKEPPAPTVAKAPEPAKPAPKAIPVPAERKLEPFLLLPMPKIVGTSHSKAMGGSVTTVFGPAREIAQSPYIELYSDSEFAKLGISADDFEKKAREAAERLITAYPPELIKDESGRVRYGVYRGERQIFACLMMAPSLGKVFENVFGKEIIVAMPDRNALYVFPPNPAVVDEFAGDMESRYELGLAAASDEVFMIKAETGEIRALGSFTSQ